ncbi:MAG: sugar ABC transporter permease [Anaerolineae bacterium]|nr:sugar ABC transporter permease [Anaerolineae bacterium]
MTAGQGLSGAGTGYRGLRRREALDAYVMITPWLLGLVLFTAGPMVASAILAFMKWDIMSPAVWTGLGNFRIALNDELLAKSLGNTAFYTFIGVPINLVNALWLAILLNTDIHGKALYRTWYYLPSVVPSVANAIVWIWILHPQFGVMNAFLSLLGIQGPNWLWDSRMAKPSLMLMNLWGIGSSCIIFLAGLQNVPQTLYEAASIDGAGTIRRFQHVTVPMLTPVIFFNLIMGFIGSFQVFTSAYIMTEGGPRNATLFYVLYLYRNVWEYFKIGYASALAWILFAIIMALTLIQLRLADRWVFYEQELRK